MKINDNITLRVGTETVKVSSCAKKKVTNGTSEKEYAMLPTGKFRGGPEGAKPAVLMNETLVVSNGVQTFDDRARDNKRGGRVAVDHPTGVEIPEGVDCVSVPAKLDVTNPAGSQAWPMTRQVHPAQARVYWLTDDGVNSFNTTFVDVVDE